MGSCAECVQGEETITLQSHLEKKNKNKNKKNIADRMPKKIKSFLNNNSPKQDSTKLTNYSKFSRFAIKKSENKNTDNYNLILYNNDKDKINESSLSDRNIFLNKINNIFSNNKNEKLSNNRINTNKNYSGDKIQIPKILFEFDEEDEDRLFKKKLKSPKHLKKREHYFYNFSYDKSTNYKNYKSFSKNKNIKKQKEKFNDDYIQIEDISDKEENKNKEKSFDSKCKTIMVSRKKRRQLNFKLKTKIDKKKQIKSRSFSKEIKRSLLLK